jgi:hypothetical protein
MGAKLSNLFSRKKKKIDQTALHWGHESPKYRVRAIGIHNPVRGVVYRKIRMLRSKFQDPEWRKKNPQMYNVFKGPVPKKKVPLDIYSPASMSEKQIKAIQSKPSYKKRYSWQ